MTKKPVSWIDRAVSMKNGAAGGTSALRSKKVIPRMLEERCCRIWDGVSETVASDIRVRDAGDVDLAAITQIYNAAIARRNATAQLEPVTIDHYGAWLRSGFPLWVAEIEGHVAGWLSCKPFLPRRSEEHTSELQSRFDLVCRLLLEKKKKQLKMYYFI